MSFATPSLTGRALRLLGQREHSRAELERKLVRYEEEPGSLAQVLDALTDKGYLSEERALQSLLHRRAADWGGARLRQQLLAQGLEGEAVRQALAELQDSEFARAQALWQRRFGAAPADARERARQSRFLLARGFAGAVVGQVLRAAGAPQGWAPEDGAESGA